jgi:hypothetical protein
MTAYRKSLCHSNSFGEETLELVPPSISILEYKNGQTMPSFCGSMWEKDDTIVNDFLDGGRRVTWYGGSRMHEETPVIQKLIRIGKLVESASS